MGKFGNIKTERSGRSFGSKLEAAVFDILCLRQKAGEIALIQQQASVYLTDARIQYIADFKCTRHDGRKFFVEAKGHETQVWRIKRRLYKYYGPDLLEIWMGSYKNPKLVETIIPNTGE